MPRAPCADGSIIYSPTASSYNDSDPVSISNVTETDNQDNRASNIGKVSDSTSLALDKLGGSVPNDENHLVTHEQNAANHLFYIVCVLAIMGMLWIYNTFKK